eukprot:7109889-Prymnesium_polylepis.1
MRPRRAATPGAQNKRRAWSASDGTVERHGAQDMRIAQAMVACSRLGPPNTNGAVRTTRRRLGA